MYGKFVTPVYLINMVLQALFSLLTPIGLMLGLAFLLVTYVGWPTWVFVVFIMLGVFSGLYSMVTFILRASRALEALERQHREKSAKKQDPTVEMADGAACDGTDKTDLLRTDKDNEE